jgi:hypothetical protein
MGTDDTNRRGDKSGGRAPVQNHVGDDGNGAPDRGAPKRRVATPTRPQLPHLRTIHAAAQSFLAPFLRQLLELWKPDGDSLHRG